MESSTATIAKKVSANDFGKLEMVLDNARNRGHKLLEMAPVSLNGTTTHFVLLFEVRLNG